MQKAFYKFIYNVQIIRFFKICHVVFFSRCHSFPDQVAIFVIKFVQKLLNENY